LLAPAFMVRARLFTLVFPALFICCLTLGASRWWVWLLLLPAQVLWTNMYHTFRLGPVICLIFALQAFLLWRRARNNPAAAGTAPVGLASWLTPLLLAGATLAATLVNPYGWRIYEAVGGIGFGSGSLLLSEQISVFSYLFAGSDTNPLIWMAAVVNLMGLVAEKRRLPLGVTVLALLGTSLAIMSPHYATVMAVLSFPFFVLSIRAAGLFLWDTFSDVVQRRHVLFGRLLLAVLLVTIIVTSGQLVSNHYYYSSGSGSAFGYGINEEALPAAAAAVLEQERFPAALINNALDGGNLLWHLPRRQVFLDARAQFHGQPLLHLAARGFAGDPQAWQVIETRLHPGAILVNCCQPQATLGLRTILATGHWSMVYFDGTSALLLLNSQENRALLQNAQLKTRGLTNLELARRAYERRIATQWFPAHSPALIGAAHTLLMLKQYAEAEQVYLTLTRGAPHMVGAWLDLGICRCQQKHWSDALVALRRATGAAPKNALAWLWLAHACQQLNLELEAREARQRAQKLNPALASAFDAETSAVKTNATPPRAP
jgi:tetratricopeptide (TPR) repeat protein